MVVRKVAVTLPEELCALVERARAVEHRSQSDIIQEALRTHFGEPAYRPDRRRTRSFPRGAGCRSGGPVAAVSGPMPARRSPVAIEDQAHPAGRT